MASAAEIIHEIETSYAGYSAAFHRDDVAGIVRYVTAPYVSITAGNPPRPTETPEAVYKQFESALAGMKSRGWVRSDFKIARIWPLSDNHGLLLSDVVRYKADGSVLESGRFCYWVRRAGPVWQMCAVSDVQPGFLGPGDIKTSTPERTDVIQQVRRDVEANFLAYNDAFHRADIPGIVGYVTAPNVQLIAGNAPRWTPTAEAVGESYKNTIATMKQRGWHKSDLKVTRVWPMSDKHAIALADIHRYKTDGSLLEKLRFFYSFRKVAPVWQMCSATDVQPAFLGPGDVPRP